MAFLDETGLSHLWQQIVTKIGNYVPTTRKVNNKTLNDDISLTASDVGALPSTTTSLKNPAALKFTGAVTGSYDGSEEKTINIPSGSGSGELSEVLSNLDSTMGDASAGSIPIYADGAAWTTQKLLDTYAGKEEELSGYIPSTAWVNAFVKDKIPEGGSGGSGGGLKKMSAVSGYLGIPAADLPQDGTVWMCISKGDGAELYSGTVTIEGGSLTANNLIAVSSGSVIQLNQATTIGVGFVIYGMSATDYVGVWQQVGAGSAAINWRGEWAEATKYSKLDAVSYEGSSYIFASDTPAIGAIPGADEEWQLMAQGGGSGTDLSLGVTGATVGQIAKITAVDTNGRPTAWAPVDMPSGGGEKEWTKIVDLEFPSEASTVAATGLQSVTELYAVGTLLKNENTTDNGLSLFVNGKKIIESGQAIRVGKSTAAVNSRMMSKYNGIYWEAARSANATNDALLMANALMLNNVTAGVGAATSIELRPQSTVVSGKLEVWAR